MDNLRIMHLSDLHYSKIKEKEINYIKEAILLDIDNYIIAKNIKPNFIIFSGDLLFKPDDDISKIDEYDNCYNFFILPILEKLSLTSNDIFITPGNHDLNRNILSRYNTQGLLAYLDDGKTTVNELVSDIISKKIELKHLNQFNAFTESLSNTNLIYSDVLSKVYIIKLTSKISIGIANLNSNILAFDDNSYGNLIIGEEQLNTAYSKIKDCDIKIANIHHAANWLKWFEQIAVKRFYYKYFNLVFLGHEHTEQPELVTFNDEDTLILNSASVYQGRNNINGYSLIDYSFTNKSADIFIREYNDRETKFGTISFNNTDNKYNYEFDILSKSKNKKNIELIIDEMSIHLKEMIKKELLINTAKAENNSIEDVFVEPHIYNQSEFIDNDSEEKELYTIKKIINSKNIIVIKGIESSGKTTLLNYIANEYLNYNTPKKLIPIILNKIDIHDDFSDHVFFSKTIEFMRKTGLSTSNKEVEQLLKDGDCIFLIDNIYENNNCLKFISEIQINHRLKNNKFIFSSKEEIFESIDDAIHENKFKNDSNVIELYIHNLKRAKAREFFQLYFRDNIENNHFEDIFKFISKLHIPLTIFNYTLIALTYETQKNNFNPINEAYLLDIFMENLLEKLDIKQNIHIGSLGYNLKSDYLIFVSKWMVENEKFDIDRYQLVSLTSEFIYALKREKENINIESLIKYMENKGIFVNAERNKLRFRYNAFLEFFIAKGMLYDERLKKIILQKNTYLNYKNEINYYSGLHGQDEELINFFKNIILEYEDYFINIKRNDGRTIFIPEVNIENDNKPIHVEQLSLEKKDKIYEQKTSKLKSKNCIKYIDKANSMELEKRGNDKKIFETNLILTKIIRNSEKLKNPTLKIEIVKLVTRNLSKFFQRFLNLNKEHKLELLNHSDNEKDTREVNHFFSLLDIVVSQAFMGLAQHNLVSDGLFTIYSEILDETDDSVLKLLVTSTMIYSNKRNNLDYIDKIINDKTFSTNRYLMMALFYKIFHAIKLREIDDKSKNKLEEVLTNIIVKLKYKEISFGNEQFVGTVKKMNIEGSRNKIAKKIKKSINDEK